MKKLTVGSLFAGIGGFDLGLERSGGFEIAWQVEIDEYCQKVLAKHWPDVARYGDIRECGAGRKYELSSVDVLCGGFPCQPHSLAGKRAASGDERDLWPETFRIIRELKPRYVLAENVMGLLSSENGRFFGGILRDLASIGYDAWWTVLRASEFGAPHQRARVFLVAYPSSTRPSSIRYGISTRTHDTTRTSGTTADMADSDITRLEVGNGSQSEERACATIDRRREGQSQPRLGRVSYGLSYGLDRHHRWPAGPGHEQHEWEPPRVTTARQQHRVARLKALGNAIVPQCAEYIARCIVTYEQAKEDAAC